MKKMQASHNEDVHKIVEQTDHKKAVYKNLNDLIDSATISMVVTDEKTKEEEPLNDGWNHLSREPYRKMHETI